MQWFKMMQWSGKPSHYCYIINYYLNIDITLLIHYIKLLLTGPYNHMYTATQ